MSKDQLKALLQEAYLQGYDEGTYTEIDGRRDVDVEMENYVSEVLERVEAVEEK